jgi:hypothetical protein
MDANKDELLSVLPEQDNSKEENVDNQGFKQHTGNDTSKITVIGSYSGLV